MYLLGLKEAVLGREHATIVAKLLEMNREPTVLLGASRLLWNRGMIVFFVAPVCYVLSS